MQSLRHNKFAFYDNASYMDAKDWLGNDYTTDRTNPESTTDLERQTQF